MDALKSALQTDPAQTHLFLQAEAHSDAHFVPWRERCNMEGWEKVGVKKKCLLGHVWIGGASRAPRREEEGGIGAEKPATTLGLNPK